MTTTSYAAVRDEQERLIRALTAAQHAETKFIVYREDKPFRDWVEANPAGCFRRFSILGTGSFEGPLISNHTTEAYRTGTVVTVAYPNAYGKYGPGNGRDMQDLMVADSEKIRDAIGPFGQFNYTVDCVPLAMNDGPEFEDLGAVRLMSLTVMVEFSRSM